jgi:hypothetical protein
LPFVQKNVNSSHNERIKIAPLQILFGTSLDLVIKHFGIVFGSDPLLLGNLKQKSWQKGVTKNDGKDMKWNFGSGSGVLL